MESCLSLNTSDREIWNEENYCNKILSVAKTLISLTSKAQHGILVCSSPYWLSESTDHSYFLLLSVGSLFRCWCTAIPPRVHPNAERRPRARCSHSRTNTQISIISPWIVDRLMVFRVESQIAHSRFGHRSRWNMGRLYQNALAAPVLDVPDHRLGIWCLLGIKENND